LRAAKIDNTLIMSALNDHGEDRSRVVFHHIPRRAKKIYRGDPFFREDVLSNGFVSAGSAMCAGTGLGRAGARAGTQDFQRESETSRERRLWKLSLTAHPARDFS
jgi:hypothetical protein